jgi:hypothetical protein
MKICSVYCAPVGGFASPDLLEKGPAVNRRRVHKLQNAQSAQNVKKKNPNVEKFLNLEEREI